MTAPPIASAVVVGYGSIGRVHARLLAQESERVAVIDFSEKALERAARDSSSYALFSDLEELARASWPISSSLFVIATWGPSHFEDFGRITGLGGQYVLCEKPIADSIERATEMVRVGESRGVALGVNFSRRYRRQAEAVHRLAREFDVGEAGSIVVHGGARGIVTNGIHLVELACDIFQAEPATVVSTVSKRHVNPRSADLGFYGGTAVYRFQRGEEMVMSLSFGSRLKEQLAVYYHDAVMSIDDRLGTRLSRIPADHGARSPAITWTGSGSELLYEGPLPDVVPVEDAIRSAQQAVRSGDRSELRPQNHVRALSACIGAIMAGELGETVSLPIAPDSPGGARRWPIS